MAQLPYRDYLRLVEAAEDTEDARAIDEFERKLAVGEEGRGDPPHFRPQGDDGRARTL